MNCSLNHDAEEPKRKRKRRRKRAIHANELTAAPDDEEPEPSKRKRRQKRAVHVSSRQDKSNQQDNVEPADNHDTDVQGLSSKRPHPERLGAHSQISGEQILARARKKITCIHCCSSKKVSK